MSHGRLEYLAAFATAAKEGSFAAAGRRLGSSRDQISKQVAALEAELATRLFRRTTRALQLTPAGATYLERIAPLLQALEAAGEALHEEGAATGLLTVSAPATFATRVLAPALPEFLDRRAGLEVRLILEDRVGPPQDGVDISIRIADAIDTDFAVEAVGTLSRGLYAAPSYLARRGTPERPDDLRAHDGLRYAAAPSPAQWVLSDGARTERVPVTGRLALDLGLAVEAAARAGAGVAVLPDFLAADGVRADALKRVLPDWSMSALTVFALVPPASVEAPKARAFCGLLRDAVARRLRPR